MAIAHIHNVVSAANSGKFTASMWIIPPADGSNAPQFGVTHLLNATTLDGNGFIRLTLELNATAGVRRFFLDMNNFDNTVVPVLNDAWGIRSVVNSYTPGLWHHILISADTAGATSGHIYVNAVDKSETPVGNETGFNVTWNGCSFGVPTSPDQASFFNTSIQMAEVQIWMGTFIDPTVAANLAKFVTIVNSVGRPANPAIAASAFGVPTYSFRGNNAQFPTNRGNGGAMSSSGIINSYTPVPGA